MGATILAGTRVSRRSFLRAVGTAGLGIAAAERLALGAPGRHPAEAPQHAAAPATDPIGDLAAALDYDPARIYRWVADEVRYEPYAGILRGARGTLDSRAGNSVDQALLLAALLDAALVPYRFAVGAIDEAAADGLLTAAEADEAGIRAHSADALARRGPWQPALAPLTPEQQAQLDQALKDAGPIIAWGRDQLDATASELTELLAGAGITLPADFTPVPDLERSGHTWVQSAITAGWVDLDPTLPDREPGETLTEAAATLDALPDELAHLIEISVMGETLGPAGLAERRLVGYAERADRLAGLPMEVANTRPEAMVALGVSIAGVLGGGTSYVPSILVGDDAIVGANPITFAAAAPGASEEPGFLEPGAADQETTAQWVELVIRSPGVEPVVTRRAIFDRIGPARRAAGGLTLADLDPPARVDDPVDGGSQVLSALSVHWFTVATGRPALDDPVMRLVPGEDGRDRAVAAHLHHLVAASLGTEVAVPAGVRPFLDAPNVTASSLAMRTDPDGQPVADLALDIWHRSHGVAPVVGATVPHPPALVTGVLAHVAERIPGRTSTAPAGPGVRPPVSVGAVFDRARADAVPLRLLQGGGATSGLAWGADAIARVERWLADGWAVVAPERPVTLESGERVGWWLVDPRTGRATDEMDDGRGGSAFEEAATIAAGPVSLATHAYRMFSFCLLGAVAVVGGAVWLGAGAAHAQAGNALDAYVLGTSGGVAMSAGAILLATC